MQSYDLEFLIKYIFRILHIAPVCFLSGQVIASYLYSAPNDNSILIFQAVNSSILMAAGFINIFVLKAK